MTLGGSPGCTCSKAPMIRLFSGSLYKSPRLVAYQGYSFGACTRQEGGTLIRGRAPWAAKAHSTASTRVVSPSVGEDPGRLYLLDLMPFMYRYTYVSPTSQGKGPAAGIPQGGSSTQHRALMLLASLLQRQPPPTHLAVVVDVPDCATWRELRYPAYKAHRPDPPPSLKQDVAGVLSVVEALEIPILAVPGVEADDVIATMATRACQEGLDVVIVSPDKDFLQLLNPKIKLLRLLSSSSHSPNQLITDLDVVQQQGFASPALWADYLALCGDASDNVQGVKGIGEKTAKELVQALGNLENILQNVENAPLKRKAQKQMLLSPEGQAAARLSKELVTLVTDLKAPPVRVPLDTFRIHIPVDGGQSAYETMNRLDLSWAALKYKDLLGKMKM